MKRIEMTGYGPPSVLALVERPAPEPGPGEVVVRQALCGVNRADCFIRSGEWPQAGGWPYVPGLEACGTVVRTGPGVTLRAGDAVTTMMQKLGGVHGARPGGYQEEVTVPEATLARVPDGLPVETAAALGLPAVTALRGLEVLDVRPGQRVLILGGSSAVGTAAIQLARARGAYVIASSSRPRETSAHMRKAGAQEIAATGGDWTSGLDPVDRVFDLVGRATFAASVSLLAPGGRLCFVGGTTGGEVSFSAWDLHKPVTLTGYSSETLTQPELAAAMAELAALVASGQLGCQPTRFPLADAAGAHAALERGKTAGRVVLVP